MEKMFRQLKLDHQKIFAVIEQMMDESETNRRQLFDQLKDELTLHMKLEEKLLYPMLKESDETHDRVVESCEEHREVKTCLERLGKALPAAGNWRELLCDLKANIDRHIVAEERGLFRQAEIMLGTKTRSPEKIERKSERTLH